MAEPYIGYRSAGRRPEQYNDRTASANAPLSAIRGYVAGTAGLPGDIEGLSRSVMAQVPPGLLRASPVLSMFGLGSRVDQTPTMPTSAFYNEYLPGADLNQTPTGKLFTGAGNLMGGAYSTNLARAGIKGTEGLASMAERVMTEAPRSGSRAAQRGVIKMKGGNWLAGSVEESLKPLKEEPILSGEIINDISGRDLFGEYRKSYEKDPTIGLHEWTKKNHPEVYNASPTYSVNNWVDKTLTKYVKNEMSTPEDPVRALAEKWSVDKPAKLAEVQSRIDDFAKKMDQTAKERGVPVADLTSMRQQMIGLEKEKDLIEAKEGLHYTPEVAGPGQLEMAMANRFKAGQVSQGDSISDLAKAYENMTDSVINGSTAANWRKNAMPETLSRIPGLEKIPDEAMIYSRTSPAMAQDLGFDHLVDELRNATNVASDLPANLRIDPADLGKITMQQAVERVSDINAWRAVQKVEANQALANNAATQLYKEYPTVPGTDVPNERGLKWVELSSSKHSMDNLPEGWSLQEFEGSSPGSKIFGIVDSKGRLHPEAAGKKPVTPEIAYENFKKGFGVKELKDALKYEGDTMAHCVGGYCEEVASGNTQIFSLRDAKGKPHATVEVKPGPRIFDTGKPEGRPGLDKIQQIKGFRNKKPDDEYIPFVQDFVKSGQWSDVGDLGNTGLRNTIDAFNSNELKKIQAAGLEVPMYATPDEIKAIGDAVWPGQYGTPPGGFAAGGYVEYDPQHVDYLVEQTRQGFKDGGKVDVDETKAAFGIYPKQRATPSSKETKEAMAEAAKFAADMVIPQTPMDAGLMLIPYAGAARKAGAALIALDAGDAEAGPLTKMLKAFHGARQPIEGVYDVSKSSAGNIMGKGLNVSTDPAYPSKWAMHPSGQAPVVYETALPVEKYIQLETIYPADEFNVLRKTRGRNPLPEGEVTGEQVYNALRGLPKSMIPDAVLKSGYRGVEYPAQDKGRWFSIYDTEGVKDRLGKKFANGGYVEYNPSRVDAIVNEFMQGN